MARKTTPTSADLGYDAVLHDVVELVEFARRSSARAVNSLITATYWAIGRRIVEQEQHGQVRADYGAALVDRLAVDLTARFGRGFGRRNLFQMRALYLAYREIPQTVSAQSAAAAKVQTASALSTAITHLDEKVAVPTFRLPWSHYVRLLSVRNPEARRFTRPKRSAAGGPSGSSIARSEPSSMSARRCPGTRPRCCDAERHNSQVTQLRPRKRSKILMFSSSWT